MKMLEEIFREYCKYFDGKLRWTQRKRKFTAASLDFFSNLGKLKGNIREEKEYLRLDYVWHAEKENSHHLELAVEHENECKIAEFLSKEIQHLIDVKADNKIAITYPTLGDESDLVGIIQEKIKSAKRKLSTPENYLLIFGFSTTKTVNGRKRRAIKFKAYYIQQDGELLSTDEETVLQGRRTLTVRAFGIGRDGVRRELKVPFSLRKVN